MGSLPSKMENRHALFGAKFAAQGSKGSNAQHWFALPKDVKLHFDKILVPFPFSTCRYELAKMVSKQVLSLTTREEFLCILNVLLDNRGLFMCCCDVIPIQ